MQKTANEITQLITALLKQLIAVESFSREEDKAAEVLRKFLKSKKLHLKPDNTIPG